MTDHVQMLDRSGPLVAAPVEVTVRRERFAARFGGLRYVSSPVSYRMHSEAGP